MILPIGDEPNPKPFVPWITWGLIAINVLVYVLITLPLSFAPADPEDPALQEYLEFLSVVVASKAEWHLYAAQITGWDLTVFVHGYRPSEPNVLDLFSSMFMHAGFSHLAGNMLFLWIYGDNVEHRMGRVGFVLLYLGTGVMATLSFAWLAGPVGTPLVGASGAISGVLGVYALVYPRNVVKLVVFLFPFFVNTFMLPAWMVLGAYVVIDNLLPLFVGGGSNVAYGAHLGGFLGGAIVGMALGPGMRLFSAKAANVGDLIAQAEHMAANGNVNRAVQLLGRAMGGVDQAERARLALTAGLLLAGADRRPEAFQWLARALKHPTTEPDARLALRALNLDPGLERRLGIT